MCLGGVAEVRMMSESVANRMPPRGRRRGRIAGLVLSVGLASMLAAVLAVSDAPAALAAESGVNVPGPGTFQVADMHALGTHWVRMFVTWPDIEPARGDYAANWIASYEQAFSSLPAGTKVLLDVVDTPSWESGSENEHVPPANPSDYAAMLGMLAQRWAGRVSAYEIWNEEDLASWWAPGPNPAAYAQLLQAAYPAVKAADPKATVVMGGLAGNDYQFLEGVYAAGGKGYFDAVGVHTDTACDINSPYEFLREGDNRMAPDSFLAYREVHSVMLANGDEKPIWMTEMSWRTTTATCSEGHWAGQKPEGVSEAQQATFLQQAYHCLAENPYVQVALWFPLQDQGGTTSGLVSANGTHKPAFAAMRDYAHEGDKLTGPCGVFTGPKITVASPLNHLTYAGPLPIHVSAKSSEGVFRIRLEVDGKLIRNYDGPAFPTTLSGTLDWQGAKHIPFGRHILTFLAYDKERNVSQVSIAVYHAKPKPKRRHRSHH
jgi:Cellulase (glycosyl hydrolase family 5)/Glycosyl hydrolase catalytic core